jgi:uncharacterized RDD family membrane protein YckC
MVENLLFCSRCGTQNPPQASFCQKCGAGLGTNLPVAAAPVVAYAQADASAGYGGFWIRFVAVIIDGIILGIGTWPIRMVLRLILHLPRYGMGPYYGGLGTLLAVVPFLFGVNIVVSWLYEALMTSSSWQATLGKRLLNLKVTDDAGNRLSFLHATGRHFAKYVSNLTLGIGYIMAGFTDRKRALHDMLAGTLVRKG